MALVRGWGPALGVGAVLGALTASYISTAGLVLFFAVMAFVMGLKMILPLEDKIIAMAPLGVAVAHRLSRRHLSAVFGIFLILAAARMAWPFLVA